MRTLKLVEVAGMVMCALLAITASAAEPELAPIAHRLRDGSPVWVSARVAFTATGELREDLFSSPARQRLDDLRSMNGNECLYSMTFPSLDVHTRMDSLENLATHAEAVVAGEVVAAEKGFYREHPGTLFSIRVSERLKDMARANRTVVHLFVGVGQIETPLGMICASTPMNATAPAIGDTVLFFAPRQPVDVENQIYIVEPHRQLLVQSADSLALPKALANETAPKNLGEAIQRVRSALFPVNSAVKVR